MIWKSFKDEDGAGLLVTKYNKGENQYVCKIKQTPIIIGYSLVIFHIGENGTIVYDFTQTDSKTKHLIKEAEKFLETL